ncbi:MAG: FAD-binding protein, partial [Candidatus Thalassarchaeaceae archaeon]|nr:FAD-binding protein [Candidatus Thalassarchaeaceae archaeon]
MSELTVQESGGKVRFSKLIEPDAGDVDITQSGVLVAVGRGIGSKDDIELAEELAELLEADLACSRPIVDAGWMEKSRQIGKSGFKVKP